MATFGQTGDGANVGTSSADINLVNRSTEANSVPASSGTINSVKCRLSLDAAGSTVGKGLVYDASGTLLAVGDEITVNNTTEAELVFPFSGGNAIYLNSGTGYSYGVMIKDPGTPNIRWSRQSTASTSIKNNTSYASGPQNPLGASTVSGPVDMYVDYTPGSPPAVNSSGFLAII